MIAEALLILQEINQTISKLRGIYDIWGHDNGLGYHELLVLYQLREKGFCSQKELCETYLLPKQTVHNIVSRYFQKGYLCELSEMKRGREKFFRLSEAGLAYAETFLEPLTQWETASLNAFGLEQARQMVGLMKQYHKILEQQLDCEG